jgi:membrane protease YdiL (CAAX protease family)
VVTLALMAAGAAAVFVGWRVVASGRGSVWVVMCVILGALGAASLATGKIVVSGRRSIVAGAGAGAGAGALLYVATVAFVMIISRWPLFDRHVAEIYDQRKGLSAPVALFLASGIVAPGEELFWRGLFEGRAAQTVGWLVGAALAWGVYIAANAFSGSLPILAAAIVSGAVWGALALWTHGVVASLVCHAVWTGLMLILPPGRQARRRLAWGQAQRTGS